MQRILHIVLTAVILTCPYICCPAAVTAEPGKARCCHCTVHDSSHSQRDQQVPIAPSPCKARDCLCGGAVLSQSVEIQFDHVLPCAIYSSQNLAATSAVQLTADAAESFCKADSGPWSTGRELRLVIDSLLI